MPVQIFQFDNIIQCRLKGDIAGTRFENIVHFRFKGGSVSSVDLASGIRNFFCNQILVLCSNQVRYTAIGMARARPGPKGFEDTQVIVPIAGAQAGAMLPNQNSFLMKIQTNFNAKLGMGRMYLPGVCTSHYANNGWTQFAVTQMNSVAQIIKNEFAIGGGTSLELGVWSRPPTFATWNGMVSIGWSTYPCIQRGRRPEGT